MSGKRIEFELTAADLIRVLPEIAVQEPLSTVLKNKNQRVSIAIAVVGTGMASIAGCILAELSMSIAPAIVAGVFIYLFASTYWYDDNRIRLMARGNAQLGLEVDSAFRSTLGPCGYELSPDYLRVETTSSRLGVFWHGIVRTLRTSDAFIIVSPGPAYHIIPATLVSYEEFEAFMPTPNN